VPKRTFFVYGRPVSPERFVDRQYAVQTLFDRILNGDSTAIIGDPHIGKSSLLRYIQSPRAQSEWLEDEAEIFRFSRIDCHLLAGDFSPADFWRRALAPLIESPPNNVVARQSKIVEQNEFGAFSLEKLFELVAQSGHRLVLLVDEFDTLLYHPNFKKAEFFGSLRAIATGTDGLILVTASRQSVHDMNLISQELNPYGSPFFNQFAEVRLRCFDDDTIKELLAQALNNTGVEFDNQVLKFLRRVTGGHPYLLQAGGATLYETISNGLAGEERYVAATRSFRRRTHAHFADCWIHLDPGAQTALTILALGEVKGRLDGRAFDTGDIGELEQFRSELDDLAEIGLVEEVGSDKWHFDWGNVVVWHGKRWRVAAEGFVWWFADNVITQKRDTIAWDKWLEQRERDGLLSRGEKERLRELAARIPKGAVSGTAKLIKSFLQGLVETGMKGA
jgi:hypothetical protein